MPSLEGIFEMLAYVRLFGEMPFRVGVLLEGSCLTPKNFWVTTHKGH